jgi:hypothetical protein
MEDFKLPVFTNWQLDLHALENQPLVIDSSSFRLGDFGNTQPNSLDNSFES